MPDDIIPSDEPVTGGNVVPPLPTAPEDEDPLVLLQAARKKAEEAQKKAEKLQQELKESPPKTSEALKNFEQKVQASEKESSKAKQSVEAIGKLLGTALIVAGVLGGGPIGLAAAWVVVKGAQILWKKLVDKNIAAPSQPPVSTPKNTSSTGAQPAVANSSVQSTVPTAPRPRPGFITAVRVNATLNAASIAPRPEKYSKQGIYSFEKNPEIQLIVSNDGSAQIAIPPKGHMTVEERKKQLEDALVFAKELGWQTIDLPAHAFNREEIQIISQACQVKNLELSPEAKEAYAALLEDTDTLELDEQQGQNANVHALSPNG